MPISKNNRLYFTQEQYEKAKANAHALNYARAAGYELKSQGHCYVLKDHDSMVFKEDGSWFWNSRRLHGSAIDFIIHYEGKSFCEAILILAGENQENTAACPSDSAPQSISGENPHPSLKMPPRSSQNKQLFGYLCRTRKLSYEVVKQMVAQKILYQSDYRTKSGHTIPNACFVSYSPDGKASGVSQRGLSSTHTFKGDVPGSDKKYGWCFHGKAPSRVYVFEAAIDAASFVSIGLLHDTDLLQNADFLALEGLSIAPIHHYLSANPQIQHITLMLDNDAAGKDATKHFLSELADCWSGTADSMLPPSGKDWNEYLQRISAESNSSR